MFEHKGLFGMYYDGKTLRKC